MKTFHIFFYFLLLFLFSCNDTYFPKPYGYFRVDLPTPTYRTIDSLNFAFKFDINSSVSVESKKIEGNDRWFDIKYSHLNASIYCSYIKVQGNIYELTEDARKFVYKHSIKADGIGEKVFENPQKKVYGILYDINGDTASSVQFILTDSVHHFFRGVLYFNNVPNKDSIAPMNNYIREDVLKMMETFEWKK